MATEKQIAANRENAKKSSGPKSSAEKEKSSRNSTTHGAFARAIVLDSESSDRFLALLHSLRSDVQPRTDLEETLVETMAAARWRQARLWAIEKASLTHELRKQDSEIDGTADLDPAVRAASQAAIAFESLQVRAHLPAAMRTMDTACDRQFYRALDTILKLRRQKAFDDDDDFFWKRSQFERDPEQGDPLQQRDLCEPNPPPEVDPQSQNPENEPNSERVDREPADNRLPRQ